MDMYTHGVQRFSDNTTTMVAVSKTQRIRIIDQFNYFICEIFRSKVVRNVNFLLLLVSSSYKLELCEYINLHKDSLPAIKRNETKRRTKTMPWYLHVPNTHKN